MRPSFPILQPGPCARSRVCGVIARAIRAPIRQMPPFSRRGSRICCWGKARLLDKQRNARAANAACFGFGLNPNKAPTCALARRSASRAQLSGRSAPALVTTFGLADTAPLSDCHAWEPIYRSAYQAKAQGRDQNEAIGTSVKNVHQRGWPEDSAKQIFKSILDAYEGKTPCRSRSWSRKGCTFHLFACFPFVKRVPPKLLPSKT